MWGLSWADLTTISVTIATLVLLEGLLSADNALVLAVMVQHLPKAEQKKALRYGIWGAFIFRAIAVIFAVQLTKYWQIKVIGGLYLIVIALKHFIGHRGGEPEHAEGEAPHKRRGQGLWWTVVYVELADIAFSVDSILAAVAMAQALPKHLQGNQTLKLSIIYAGGVLGIIMMRMVAGFFLVLLNRYKGLAGGAYVLVGWIGLKLFGSGIHDGIEEAQAGDWLARLPGWARSLPWEMPTWLFWSGMALVVLLSIAYKPPRRSHQGEATSGAPGPEA